MMKYLHEKAFQSLGSLFSDGFGANKNISNALKHLTEL